MSRTVAPPRAASPTEPLVGNYFVSAYPPFSCWTAEALEAYRGRLARTDDGAQEIGLYVHVPFCAARCHYCYYLSHADRTEEMDPYIGVLPHELELYARSPALAGRRVSFVYFGGGTPSLLSVPRIRRLMGGLRDVLDWDDAREVSFECAPRSVTEDKCRALREEGVTRISLGVQQLDDGVLARNGRIHRVRDVERAYEAIRGTGFDVVNLDLIVGLVGETEASFDRTLERVVSMSPEAVTLYQLEIPMNTPLYRQLRDGQVAGPPAPWEQKRERLERGFARLESAGYTVRSAYCAVRDPARHRFVYQDEQYLGADLLGLGVSSFSYLGGVHQQNATSLSDYIATLSAGRLPLGRAYALRDEERLVRELVLRLKLGRVDLRSLRSRFGEAAVERALEPVPRLVRMGWLALRGEILTPTRQGLLRIDRLLPELYLPEHRDLRYS